MIQLVTNNKIIPAKDLQDGDWVIGDVGDDQLMLVRYQDSLQQGDFHPVIMNPDLLKHIGFAPGEAQPEGHEAETYALNNFEVSVINAREYIFEGDAQGRKDVHYLHLLQQVWREHHEEEFPDDIFEQPHTIELTEE